MRRHERENSSKKKGKTFSHFLAHFQDACEKRKRCDAGSINFLSSAFEKTFLIMRLKNNNVRNK